MMKKTRLYLLAIAVLAFALLLSGIAFFMSPEMSENAPEGSEAFNVPNASTAAEVTPASETEESDLLFLNKRGYISESGCPTLVGEVKNAGNLSMSDILITASFYCGCSKLMGAKEGMPAITSGYTELEILAPGEKSPFKIVLSVEQFSQLKLFDVDKIEKYKTESDYNTTDEELYKSFEISQSRGELDNSTGHYKVVGMAKNIGNETAKQIKVVGTFYDNQDRIVEVMHTYLQDPLRPGDEAQFEITALDKTIAQRIETYYIQAVGP